MSITFNPNNYCQKYSIQTNTWVYENRKDNF